MFAIEVETGRPHPRAARHEALVRPVRRAAHPRHPALPGPGGLDAALHGERRRARARAGLPGPVVPAGARVSAPSSAVLLDVEGTTTPIDFVYRVLFPYARERYLAFLSEHFADAGRRGRGRRAGGGAPARRVRRTAAARLGGLARGRGRLRLVADRPRPQVDGAQGAAGADLGKRASARASCRRACTTTCRPRSLRWTGAGKSGRDLLLGQRARAADAVRAHAGGRPHAAPVGVLRHDRSGSRPSPRATGGSPRASGVGRRRSSSCPT